MQLRNLPLSIFEYTLLNGMHMQTVK